MGFEHPEKFGERHFSNSDLRNIAMVMNKIETKENKK
jgi:hypothetical protein